jgi:hypothetical protein
MIRKTLTTFGAALGLTIVLATSASATIVDTYAIDNVTMNFGSGLSTIGFFGDGGYAAGTTLDDYFLYFSPPVSSQTDFEVFADVDGNFTQTFKLTGFDFGVFGGFVVDDNGYFAGFDFEPLATDQTFLARSGAALGGESTDFLDSGIYYVEVKGTVEEAGGGFSGEINTTPIPEPSELLLLLGGLGVVGALARRRHALG